jgi:moderate conductance mechanosensitive channel
MAANAELMFHLSDPIARIVARWFTIDAELALVLARVITVAGTLLVLLLIYRGLTHVIDRVILARQGEATSLRAQRVRTLGPLLTNTARWVMLFVALIIVLREFGIDVQALLVSAGVLGLALSLGAQTLIRDVITGFFLLFEGLVAVGDTIEVGPHTGVVEGIGLRVTKVRMLNGALRVVPNGQLTEFTNYSQGWARAVVEVGVPYDMDVKKAIAVLERVGADWAAQTDVALDVPQAQGILRFGEADVVLRLLARVDPSRRFDAEMELRQRIKEAFDRERIPVPFVRRVMYLREDATKEPTA